MQEPKAIKKSSNKLKRINRLPIIAEGIIFNKDNIGENLIPINTQYLLLLKDEHFCDSTHYAKALFLKARNTLQGLGKYFAFKSVGHRDDQGRYHISVTLIYENMYEKDIYKKIEALANVDEEAENIESSDMNITPIPLHQSENISNNDKILNESMNEEPGDAENTPSIESLRVMPIYYPFPTIKLTTTIPILPITNSSNNTSQYGSLVFFPQTGITTTQAEQSTEKEKPSFNVSYVLN